MPKATHTRSVRRSARRPPRRRANRRAASSRRRKERLEEKFSGEVTSIVASEPIAKGTHWIRIERPPNFDWKPGQFTILELVLRNGHVQDHMFSIASSPTSKALEIATRTRRTAFKRAFQRLAPGDKVAVHPADGTFVLDARHPAVFVTGGIGITAVKAMLEYATDKAVRQPMVLLNSNPGMDAIAFRDELEELARANERIRVHHTLTEDPPSGWTGRTGRIDAPRVREVVRGLDEPIFYVCGPPSMVRDLRRILVKEVGVPATRVKTEDFTGYP